MNYKIELQELKEKSVDRLACAEVYDKEAFAALEGYLKIRAREEKAPIRGHFGLR